MRCCCGHQALSSATVPALKRDIRVTCAKNTTKRSLLLGLASVSLLGRMSGTPPAVAMSPYEEARNLKYGPTQEGTVRACPSNVNPNCVSTASTNDAYGPAWRSSSTDAAAAAEEVDRAVMTLFPGSELMQSQRVPAGEYRAYGVDSNFGKDVVEFLIKNDSVTDRNWAGDRPGALVTYRSMAGSVKYLWPIQTPITDFDSQRKRLDQIRRQLGWQVIGCELLECYDY